MGVIIEDAINKILYIEIKSRVLDIKYNKPIYKKYKKI